MKSSFFIFIRESLWDLVKIHWMLANIPPLKKFRRVYWLELCEFSQNLRDPLIRIYSFEMEGWIRVGNTRWEMRKFLGNGERANPRMPIRELRTAVHAWEVNSKEFLRASPASSIRMETAARRLVLSLGPWGSGVRRRWGGGRQARLRYTTFVSLQYDGSDKAAYYSRASGLNAS